MAKKKWSELSQRTRMLIIVGGTIQIVLLVAALIDIKRRPASGIRGPKALWGALAFVDFFGPLSYFAFGRRRH